MPVDPRRNRIVVAAGLGLLLCGSWIIYRTRQIDLGPGLKVATEALLVAPLRSIAQGGRLTIYGEAPGTPRTATAVLRSSPGGDSTQRIVEVDLVDTLAADHESGWVDRCVSGASLWSLSISRIPRPHWWPSRPAPAAPVVRVMYHSTQLADLSICPR